MTCKDILEGCKKCIHYSVCSSFSPEWFVYNHKETCKDFKDKSEYTEVKQGEWIPTEYDGYADGCPVWDLWECSECHEEHRGDEETLTCYCPHCGAKMDGKEGAEE